VSFINKIRYYPKSLILRFKIATTRSLLDSPQCWHALDRLNIYGFGTDILRVDFPPKRDSKPLWGHGSPPHPGLVGLFDSNLQEHLEYLKSVLEHAADYHAWPNDENRDQTSLPWRNNEFLPPFDSISLYGMLRSLRPERYLEIGSGISTRVAYQARRAGQFQMDIISIDPEPRFDVSQLCDEVHRVPIESLGSPNLLRLVTPRTMIFLDGSHRSFPGSDVTIFFLNLLPQLPSGCVIQIHDIYLPNDYPHRFYDRLWSEQYLLATWLLGGASRMRVILPCAHLASKAGPRKMLTEALHTDDFGGSSFWFQVVDG
jgi:hypothetical protein